MSTILWDRLVSTCIAIVPLWLLLSIWWSGKPWLKWTMVLIMADALFGFTLTMLMVWGWVHL